MAFRSSDEIAEALRSTELTVLDLYVAWEQRQPVPEVAKKKVPRESRAGSRQIPWIQDDLTLAKQFIASALEKEEFLLVCDGAREVLRYWTRTNEHQRTELVSVRMLYASALTRLGFTNEARRELEPYLQTNFQPPLGRLLKVELFLQLGDIMREEAYNATARAARLQKAEEALGFYQSALELDPSGLKPLLLTAAVSQFIAEPGSTLLDQAHEKARQVLQLVDQLDDTVGPRIESTGSRGTAQAILGLVDEAAGTYSKLGGMHGITTACLAETRYNAQFLAEALGRSRDFFKPAFPPLDLIVFAGHLLDRPNSNPLKPKRFPADSVGTVRERLRAALKTIGARVGLVSGAAGADLLFVEALRELNGELHLVLPWSRDEFRQSSVDPFEPAHEEPVWGPLFERAIKEAKTIRELGQSYSPSSDLGWQYTTEVAAGLAIHAARVSRLDVKPMALWDGGPGRGVGGTASFVEFWHHQLNREVVTVELPRRAEGGVLIREPQDRSERPTIHQQVKSMLFADIVGYSKLSESVIPEFIETFLSRVSQLAASSKHAPRSVNTWGDAVYAVFDFAQDAGCFALELTQMIIEGKNDWLQKGLYWTEPGGENEPPVEHPLSIRVGLHTGPVFMHYDPVVRQLGFTGAHVNRAARIEPVAKPGEVFASEEFAALAELDKAIQNAGSGSGGEGGGFICEYAGSMSLAKGYPGRFRIYRVVPRRQLVIDEMAQAVHELYCAEAKARGETIETNSALCPWAQLPETLKEANRAQMADIPNKLRLLGYELAPGHGLPPAELAMTAEQLEVLSIREHDRWMKDRRRNGWTYAPIRDNSRKYHHLLIPWEELSHAAKELDRDAVRNLPKLIEKAGFRIRRL